jgi:hypothetical protein
MDLASGARETLPAYVSRKAAKHAKESNIMQVGVRNDPNICGRSS